MVLGVYLIVGDWIVWVIVFGFRIIFLLLFLLIIRWIVIKGRCCLSFGCRFRSIVNGWIFWGIRFSDLFGIVVWNYLYLLIIGVDYCVGYLWYWWSFGFGWLYSIDGWWVSYLIRDIFGNVNLVCEWFCVWFFWL